MEGERRKRKLEDEEENEEQKIEKFFALIKRTKDVLYKEKTDKKIDGERGGSSSIWNPKFKAEDFIDCVQMGKSDIDDHAVPSHKELTQEKQDLQEAMTATPTEAEEKYKPNDVH